MIYPEYSALKIGRLYILLYSTSFKRDFAEHREAVQNNKKSRVETFTKFLTIQHRKSNNCTNILRYSRDTFWTIY